MTRIFEDKIATREATPCMIGIVGPSGTGKTFSALRLATGMQKITGGDIGMIDTEARRGLHYADRFRFRHLPFGAPFGSLDYLAAIQHFIQKGVTTIIVDSMSHEHEGPGGVLEQHEAETKRLAALWHVSEVKAQMNAWGPAKASRRRMINEILQTNANMIFCFRAKEKLRIVPGQNPEPRGYQPIAGEEFLFEMLVNFLLLPGAKGRPTWQSTIPDEQAMMKIPIQFQGMFPDGMQLSEDLGQLLAEWSSGVKKEDPLAHSFLNLGVTEKQIAAYLGHSLKDATKDERARLKSFGSQIKEGSATWDTLTTSK